MIKFYNTLSRKKEDFKSLKKGVAKIYSCGPTVYSYQQIGNMRAAVFVDILKRVLRYFGYKVEDVINITDVGHLVSDSDSGEDKMLKAAKKENKDPYEIARYYENVYVEDSKKLNIILPKNMPRATDHIKEQLNIIEKLEKNSLTYVTSDGVYFDTSKFKQYGKLSRQKLEDKKAGARVKVDTEKKNPTDFALWKFLTKENQNHVMKWKSKWGVGFPGWHLECSAMSHKYLGSEFDIHTGGIEHIPIHHENEIAQNLGSKSVTKINYWIHNAHLIVDGTKMSKSLGNVYLISDLEKKGYDPLALRELMLRTHYRKSLNFTFESLDSGVTNLKRINEFNSYLDSIKVDSKAKSDLSKVYKDSISEFEKAISDDLNTVSALSVLYDFMNKVNKKESFSSADLNLAKKFLKETDKVFGLLSDSKVPKKVVDLAKKREVARKNKDFEMSDKLRDQITKEGYIVRDVKESKTGFVLDKIK